MKETTLLYGALAATGIAALYAITHTHSPDVPATAEPLAYREPNSVVDDPPALARAEVPIRLTASDGTGLTLSSMSANAVLEDPLALTELHLVFENPNDRVLEGTFRITLPQGASLSRFAMKVGEAWQEGEVVEKQAARRAYEDFLHRRQDPALMEQGAGNEFAVRVFPIPARGKKELIVTYSELLKVGAPFVLPLRGLPMLGNLDVDVHAVGSQSALEGGRTSTSFSLHQQRFQPAENFVVPSRQIPRSPGLRSGEFAIARVVPFAESRPEPIESAVVLVDTSASRALGLAEEAKLVESTIAKLPSKAFVTVACFDQEIAPIYEGNVAGYGTKQTAAILARKALGATDVDRAIGWAAETAKKASAKRVVLVGDGVATAGEIDAQKLRERVEKLRDAGVERMDAVATGGIRDDAFFRTIVHGVLNRDGVVLDGKLGASAVAKRLQEATTSGLPVKVEGARWSWPEQLDGLQAGDQVMVYAELDPSEPVSITVGNQKFMPNMRTIDRPLVERAWASAKIQSLIEAPQDKQDNANATKRAAIDLSTRHRVLSPYTALLVLETDWDYQRFGIDRNATVNILTVDAGRVAVTHAPRRAPRYLEEKTRETDARANDRESSPSARMAARAAPQPAPAPMGEAATAADESLETPTAAAAAAPVTAERPPAAAAMEPPAAAAVPMAASKSLAAPMAAAAADANDRRADDSAPNVARRAPMPRPAGPRMSAPADIDRSDWRMPEARPYEGRMRMVMDKIAAGNKEGAFIEASNWQMNQPGDVMALVALGEASEAIGEVKTAARAYGSILELFSFRADSRRFAGERLERLNDPLALRLATDTYGKAAEQRPDHPASHRLYAYALLKSGEYERAFAAMKAGATRSYPQGRFPGVTRILKEDLGLIAAAWAKAEPARSAEIMQKLHEAGGIEENGPSLRFVLVWETDANDVDFHIRDANGGHAYYKQLTLPSGGELYADVTTGYGPECFTIRTAKAARAYPYELQAHYYSRGPMGYGMGKLEIIDHDGKGNLTFEERPFVVMADRAYVDLGVVKGAIK
ncbi:MAG: hypothetical protein FWD73_04290 [Polyangiaceae bacterium]|nr:hypothetical protein [Polyangiaceae bacterium]